MIIKNISKYVTINKLTYLFILIGIFMASFRMLFYIFFLIIIHEFGHFITAKFFGVELEKIHIYPLGGVAKFYMPYNFSNIKELIILINGPLFQEIGKIILLELFPLQRDIIISYHYGILLFNLLPIYPLDGGKILNILLSIVEPFKLALKHTIVLSYLMVVFLLFININNIKINTIIMITFLLLKISLEYKKINMKYESFLLERYLNKYRFKKSKIINNSNSFYKNKRHLIIKDGKYVLEADYLVKKYEK